MSSLLKYWMSFSKSTTSAFVILVLFPSVCFSQGKPSRTVTINWLKGKLNDREAEVKVCFQYNKPRNQGFDRRRTAKSFSITDDTMYVSVFSDKGRFRHEWLQMTYHIPLKKVSNVQISNNTMEFADMIAFSEPVLFIYTAESSILVESITWGIDFKRRETHPQWQIESIKKNLVSSVDGIPIKWDQEVNFQDRILMAFSRLIDINNQNDPFK